MTLDDFHALAMRLPAAKMDIKWGADRCFTVGGKMFAATIDGPPEKPVEAFSIKTSDASFEQLIAEGVAVPSPYLARAKWVRVVKPEALTAEEVRRYLEMAHALVTANLTRKLRAELGL
jgi:predicted DNA-binding protein (MmcQ/YjbR family)